MFERFTERARRVVVLAQEEARLLGHNYIGTEHLLLGLLHEGDGVGARALTSLDIDLAGVRLRVEEIIGSPESGPGSSGGPASGHIPFTPRAKRVLELSLREALELGHRHIGTEHILLGLVREGDGVAAQVLKSLGASAERVRAKVTELAQAEPIGPDEPESLGTRLAGRVPMAGRMSDLTERITAVESRLASIESLLQQLVTALSAAAGSSSSESSVGSQSAEGSDDGSEDGSEGGSADSG